MNFFKKLHEVGRGSVTSTQLRARLFAPLDLHFLRERERIEERAKNNGTDNLPPTHTNTLDSVENALDSAAQDALREYVDDYEGQLALYRGQVKRNIEVLNDFSIANEFKQTTGNLTALVRELKSSLYEKNESIKALSNEILHFRKDHGLLHRVPAPGNPWATAAKLFLAGILEVVLTALLIRDAGDLATVFGVASVFFVLNILVVFFLFGRFVKQVHANKNGKPNWTRRFFGAGALLAFLCYAAVLNLVFSHLRSVSAEIEQMLIQSSESYLDIYQNIGAIAWQRFLNDGASLPDVYSYGLFVFGLSLSIYAFLQGWESGDRYPGYGSYIKRFQEAFEEYQETIEYTIEEFKKARDEGRKNAESKVKEIERSFKDLPEIDSRSEGLYFRFEQACNELEAGLNTLLQEYRQGNIKARSEPAPPHFHERRAIMRPQVQRLKHENVAYPTEMVIVIKSERDRVYELFTGAINEVEELESVLKRNYPFSVEAPTNG